MTAPRTILCRPRLGELPVASFQAALDRFELGEFVSAEPIQIGSFGQNVFLNSTRGNFVFRGAPHDPHQFAKERYFAEQLHLHTRTPVPWPFLIDDSSTLFPWPYVIMPCMPGAQLAEPAVVEALTDADWLSLAQTMGETIAEMQRLTRTTWGKFDGATGTVVSIAEPYAKWFVNHMRWYMTESRKSPRTTDADLEWIDREFQRLRPALEAPFTSTYVMGDLNISNLTAEKTGEEWKITGVFDLVQSYFGNGEEDLIELAFYLNRPELVRAYFAAYRRSRKTPPGFEERMQVYVLASRLKSWQWLTHIESPHLPKEGGLREWVGKSGELLKSVL